MESNRGEIRYAPSLIKAELKEMEVTANTISNNQKKQAKLRAKDKYLAALLLATVNNSRYKALKDNLDNNYTLGRDDYLKTPQEIVSILESYKAPKNSSAVMKPSREDSVMFSQGESWK